MRAGDLRRHRHSRLPFYRIADVAHVTRGDAADINTPRVSRLLPGTEYLMGSANVEMRTRWIRRCPRWAQDAHGVSHLDVEAGVESLRHAGFGLSPQGAEYGALHTYSFGYYRTFLDGRAIVRNNSVRLDKALILKLLGVDYVIDGVGLSRVNPEFAYDFPVARGEPGSSDRFPPG